MPNGFLTPKDIAEMLFTSVRGDGDGYDMREVDLMLDDVEETLKNRDSEIDELKQSLAAEKEQNGKLTEANQSLLNELNSVKNEMAVREEEFGNKYAELQNELHAASMNSNSGDGSNIVVSNGALQVTTSAEASAAVARLLEQGVTASENMKAEGETEKARLIQEGTDHVEKLINVFENSKAKDIEHHQTQLDSMQSKIDYLTDLKNNLHLDISGYLGKLSDVLDEMKADENSDAVSTVSGSVSDKNEETEEADTDTHANDRNDDDRNDDAGSDETGNISDSENVEPVNAEADDAMDNADSENSSESSLNESVNVDEVDDNSENDSSDFDSKAIDRFNSEGGF